MWHEDGIVTRGSSIQLDFIFEEHTHLSDVRFSWDGVVHDRRGVHGLCGPARRAL